MAGRLPVPSKLNAAHFCATLSLPALNPEIVVSSVESVLTLRETEESENHFELGILSASKELTETYLSVLESCGLLPFIKNDAEFPVEIVHCQQVAPHSDLFFEGTCFLNYVLHATPSGYSFGCVSEKRNKDGKEVQHTRLDLGVESWFFFDPTDLHFAIPKIPDKNQLLMLAQIELKDVTKSDRLDLFNTFQPHL